MWGRFLSGPCILDQICQNQFGAFIVEPEANFGSVFAAGKKKPVFAILLISCAAEDMSPAILDQDFAGGNSFVRHLLSSCFQPTLRLYEKSFPV